MALVIIKDDGIGRHTVPRARGRDPQGPDHAIARKVMRRASLRRQG
jgi:hypothetical protein